MQHFTVGAGQAATCCSWLRSRIVRIALHAFIMSYSSAKGHAMKIISSSMCLILACRTWVSATGVRRDSVIGDDSPTVCGAASGGRLDVAALRSQSPCNPASSLN